MCSTPSSRASVLNNVARVLPLSKGENVRKGTIIGAFLPLQGGESSRKGTLKGSYNVFMLYNLTLALHLLSIILWLGGLMHAMGLSRQNAVPVLNRAVHPGAMLAVLTGFVLAFWHGWFAHGWWLPLKLVLVIFLIPITVSLKRLAEAETGNPEEPLAGASFRIGVTILSFAILFLAIHKFL